MGIFQEDRKLLKSFNVVDPRIELLSAVQLISAYDRRYHLMTRFDFPYKQQMLKTFSPFRNHPAVKVFDEMSQNRFNFDAPPAAMLYLTPPPELKEQVPFSQEILERSGGCETIGIFLAALHDFAVETDFAKFYASNLAFYEKVSSGAAELVNESDLEVLEQYFGMRQRSYHIVLAPMFHEGGFGSRIARHNGVNHKGVKHDGENDVYSINGTHEIKEGVPGFGSRLGYRYLIWHEFSHSFVNPLTAACWDQIEPYSKLFTPIQNEMLENGYEEWSPTVNEHIIRAINVRLEVHCLGEEEGKKTLEAERKKGFRYIVALADRLVEYEENREKYPTLESFYPRLVEVFLDIAVERSL